MLFQDPTAKKTKLTERPVDTATQYSEPREELKIVKQLEGTPWEGTYYQQILRDDDSPISLDLLVDPTIQQYRKIERYNFLLQGELGIALSLIHI